MMNFFRSNRLWGIALGLMLSASVYWGLFAANRWVSESHILVESLQAPAAEQLSLSSLLSGSAHSRDLLLLRDYLLSTDMLRILDGKLSLREHFRGSYDIVSRLWSKDVSLEWFQWYFQRRVEVVYDDYAGILTIRAQAYTPEMAHRIASAMVEEGERFMNELAHKLAREQVSFAELEVAKAGERVAEKRKALIAYQNKYGLVSPSATVGTVSAVVARMEGELSALHARRRMLAGYLAPGAPELVQINAQVRAVEQQLVADQARLASPKGLTLNIVAERYERLLLDAEFAQDLYKAALGALEQSRIEATRTLKKVSVLQRPTQPEYPLEPQRFYNIIVFVLATLLIVGILRLLIAIIREHRD